MNKFLLLLLTTCIVTAQEKKKEEGGEANTRIFGPGLNGGFGGGFPIGWGFGGGFPIWGGFGGSSHIGGDFDKGSHIGGVFDEGSHFGGGFGGGSHIGGGFGGVGGVSSGCRYKCKNFSGQFYCCEDDSQIQSPVGVKPGFCPYTRFECPGVKAFGPPKICSNDYSCPGLEKCCQDVCLMIVVCKTPDGVGGGFPTGGDGHRPGRPVRLGRPGRPGRLGRPGRPVRLARPGRPELPGGIDIRIGS